MHPVDGLFQIMKQQFLSVHCSETNRRKAVIWNLLLTLQYATFLDGLRYCSRLICRLAIIFSALHAATPVNAKWFDWIKCNMPSIHWRGAHITSFAYYQFAAMLAVRTNRSSSGARAVLAQKQEDARVHTIHFGGQMMNPAERKY